MKKAFIQKFLLTPAIFALGLLAAGCLSRPALVRQDFVLQTPPIARPAPSPVGGVLALTSCDISPPFAGQALVYRIGPNAFETDPYAGFLVTPDKTAAIAIRTWLSRSGLFASVVKPGSSMPFDQFLEVYVDELYGDLQQPAHPQAVLSLSFVLGNSRKGNGAQVLFQKEYSRHLPVAHDTAAAIVAGWNQALGEIMSKFASDLTNAHKSMTQNPSP